MNRLELRKNRDLRLWRGRRLKAADRSFDSVLVSEFLEKYDFNRGLAVLREAIRVLTPGGIVRIVTPDFDFGMASIRSSSAPDVLQSALVSSDGTDSACTLSSAELWNAWFHSNGRKFIYDFATIGELLRLAGFERIARTAPQESDWAADEYRSAGADGLLVVEAMRPAAECSAPVASAPHGPWRRRLSRNPVLRKAVFETRKVVRRFVFSIPNRLHIRHYLRQHTRKLHIAAGTAVLDGWLNTDLYARLGVAYLDLTRPFPFPDATFDYVFSEHHFTNFRPETALEMFREVWRVLKPTGVLRVATPHLEFLRELCVPQKTELQQRYIEWACKTFCPDVGVCNHAVVVNNFAHNWGNQFIYDVPAVISLMARAGFDRFVRCEVGQSEDPELRDLEFHGRVIGEEFNRLETIVLEARRGAQPPRVDK